MPMLMIAGRRKQSDQKKSKRRLGGLGRGEARTISKLAFDAISMKTPVLERGSFLLSSSWGAH